MIWSLYLLYQSNERLDKKKSFLSNKHENLFLFSFIKLFFMKNNFAKLFRLTAKFIGNAEILLLSGRPIKRKYSTFLLLSDIHTQQKYGNRFPFQILFTIKQKLMSVGLLSFIQKKKMLIRVILI
jgi:hypothetical protein